MIRLNRVRLLMSIAHDDRPSIPRGMGGFRRWVHQHGLVENAWGGGHGGVAITQKGREALQRAVKEYERHNWFGLGGAFQATQRAMR